MREIKFRAWDGDEMLNHKNLCCPSTSLGEILNGELEVMQYTGLRNSKGVEIFEGDIVFMKSHEGNKKIFEVVYDNASFQLRRYSGDKDCDGERMFESFDNGDYYRGDDIYWDEAKIIGNIYEPKYKELLK